MQHYISLSAAGLQQCPSNKDKVDQMLQPFLLLSLQCMTGFSCSNIKFTNIRKKEEKLYGADLVWFLPEVPIGDVAGVPLWTLSPNDWEAADGKGWTTAPEGPGRGPGGVSLCGDVRGVLRGVLGWDVCPPASRASRLLRILEEYINIDTF